MCNVGSGVGKVGVRPNLAWGGVATAIAWSGCPPPGSRALPGIVTDIVCNVIDAS